MSEDIKIKVQNSLIFHQSDLWESVNWIIDEAYKSESIVAISQSIDEDKRAHQCGRVDGILFIKELLESTRAQALANTSRKTS
jgi:hypothetical protein